MTLIEACVFLAICGLGAVGGIIAGETFGWIFAVPGMIVGMAILPHLVWLACQLEPLFSGQPRWPRCRRCGDADMEIDRRLAQFVMYCSCGRCYVRRGRQCLLVTSTGATRPYLRWHMLRGWCDESVADAPEMRTPYRCEPENPARVRRGQEVRA